MLRIQGDLDPPISLYGQALTTFKEAGDRSTFAAVNVSLAKAFISKQDFAAARRVLREALSINQEIGARGEAALDKVMLARVGFLSDIQNSSTHP